MTQDFLGQFGLDPAKPKTWEPLLRHAAAEIAAQIVEIAAHDPACAQSMARQYVFKALKGIVDVADLAGASIGEDRALDALLDHHPSCRTTFGDFETFREAVVAEERRSRLEQVLNVITASPLVQ